MMEETETKLSDEDLTKAKRMAAFVNKTIFPAMPALNLEQSKTLITEYLKIYEINVENPAVGFKCTWTESPNAAELISQISPLTKDVKNDSYSLRAISGWYRDYEARRASPIRLALNEVLNQNQELLTLIKAATVGLYEEDAPPPDAFEYFQLFNAVIAKIADRHIRKTELGIKTYVKCINYQEKVDALEDNYGSLCATTITKEEAVDQARKTDEARKELHSIFQCYLQYFSENDEKFIQAIFPATRIEKVFDIDQFAANVRDGTLGLVHYNSASTNASQITSLRNLSKRTNETSEKILKFNLELVSSCHREVMMFAKQVENILEKAKQMRTTKLPTARLQLFLDRIQELQKEALKLAKIMPWSKENFGIEQSELEDLICEVKEKLDEALTTKKIEEDAKRNATSEISNLRSKSDFLPWIKI